MLLGSVQNQLGWDEQTYLPPGGAAHRADQMSLLAGMVHQQLTTPRLGELISALETAGKPPGSNGVFDANLREARRRYDRLTKLPTRLVEELTRVTSLAQQNWVEARKKSNFEMFRPWLEKIVALKQEEAAALGGGTGIGNGAPTMRCSTITNRAPSRPTWPRSLPRCGRRSFRSCGRLPARRSGPMSRSSLATIRKPPRRNLPKRRRPPSASVFRTAGSTSRRIRFAAAWARATAG